MKFKGWLLVACVLGLTAGCITATDPVTGEKTYAIDPNTATQVEGVAQAVGSLAPAAGLNGGTGRRGDSGGSRGVAEGQAEPDRSPDPGRALSRRDDGDRRGHRAVQRVRAGGVGTIGRIDRRPLKQARHRFHNRRERDPSHPGASSQDRRWIGAVLLTSIVAAWFCWATRRRDEP